MKADGLDTTGEGFDQGSRVVGNGRRYGKNEILRHDTELGKAAVAFAAHRLALRTEEVLADLAISASPTGPGGRGQDRDPISGPNAVGVLADLDHVARELMAQGNRRVKAVAAVADVQVGSTEPPALHRDLDVSGMCEDRFGNVAQGDMVRAGFEFADGAHRSMASRAC